MMKFKQGIIYTLILAMLSTSFGYEKYAFADDRIETTTVHNPATVEAANEMARQEYLKTPAEENALPASKITYEVLDRATEVIQEKGVGSFSESPQVRKEIAKEAAEPPMEDTDVAKEKWLSRFYNNNKENFWGIFKSFITGWVLLRIASANKIAHDKNLLLTPENEKKLSDQLGDPLSVRVLLPNVAGTITAGGINWGLTKFWLATRQMLLFSKGTGILFKYLVSGALMSIGNQYIQGFIVSASQEVFDHPELFGGLTQEQRGAIRLLQYRAGMAYFLTALVSHSSWDNSWDPNPTETHKYEVFNQIAWKIEMAMNLILMHDPDLRDALWAHLWSQAFLQGNNGLVIASSWVSERFVLSVATADSYWKKNWKILWLSIATGFAASLIPNVAKDWGTAKANSSWAWSQGAYQHGILWWNLHLVEAQTPLGRKNIIETYISEEGASRQSRVIKYVYLMKLAIDNMTTLQIEKNQIALLKKSEGQALLPQAKNWKDKVVNIYNKTVGMDFLPESWRAGMDESYVESYRKIFDNSVRKILGIYAQDSNIFNDLRKYDIPPETRFHLTQEIIKANEMWFYFDHQGTVLSQRWTSTTPSPKFEPTRQNLEQMSFWGVHETKIIDSIYEAATLP